jgi:hypothetical protein
MNHVVRRTLWVVAFLAGVVQVGAFPTWMGVYGPFARHTGENPGQFTILMNEDYFGLEANVGIRVNGGDWEVVAMAYQTNVSGNSVWTYVPSVPFPFGAEVEYYFHGYEGASNVYDSAGGGNYFSGPLFWSSPADTGLVSAYPGNQYGRVRMCALGKDLIGAQALTILNLGRKPVGLDWEALSYPLDDTGVTDVGLAGNGGTLLVACMIGTNLAVRTSADRGETFSASLSVATQPDNGTFSGLSVSAGGPGEFGIAYGLATNCCGAQQIFFLRTADNGATWSAPAVAMSSGDSSAYFSWLELGHNDNGWYLAGLNVWQGSSLIMYCARSALGTTWEAANLGGNKAWNTPDLSLSSNTACIAADPYYDSFVRVWRDQGSGWTTQGVARALESGRPVRLSHNGRGHWYVFRQVDNTGGGWPWSWFLSRDNGQTWTTNRALLNPTPMNANDSFTVEQALNVGAKQYLLWNCSYYKWSQTFQQEAQLQKSDGYDELLDDLIWDGSTFTAVITNIAPGATNHLEVSDTIVAPTWTNAYTWTGGAPATNWTGTANTQGYFRIRVER